ncbi:MAG: HAMP domain-containing histidine kinase, partial [Sphingobacteriales bacterium]
LGLADRINLFRKQLATQVLENEKLKLLKEQEQKRLIEDKNRELEIKIIESTAEVVKQKEDLAKLNTELEKIVAERTLELSIANTDLHEVNSELAAFIYRTSHDVRGPLSRLLGLCHVGLLDISDLNALEYLEKIQFTAHKMDIILKRLSKLFEITQLETQNDEILFPKLVKEILDELPDYQSDIKINIQENLQYIADFKLIKFVVFNLVENALKFSNIGENANSLVKIDIVNDHDYIKIQVSDNGSGISEDEAQYIFHMFSQIGMKYENTGLGLYMVKKILDRMGGTITMEKSSEGFTQFTIKLPLTEIQVPQIKSEENTVTSAH